MKLTTKGRYAVTAMLDLALHGTNGPVALAEISERQELSLSYLEQLFAKLRKPLSKVAVAEIIFAVNESVDATNCSGRQDCLSHGRCLTHDLWESLSQQIEEFLSGVSLQDLIDRHAASSDEQSAETVLLQRNLSREGLSSSFAHKTAI